MTEIASAIQSEDRVRAHTAPEVNQQFDRELERRIRFYAAQEPQVLSERIVELDREWDIERALETNAAAVALTGMFLGVTASRKWFILPAIVSGFLLQHAVQGWCPPMPALRRLGFRTRIEIERERYALKALRGDFAKASGPEEIVKTVQRYGATDPIPFGC